MVETRFAVRTVTRGLLVAGSLMALSLSVIVAQSPQQQRVDIRFEFAAAGKDLPAGSYRVTMAKDKTGHVELVLFGKGTETHVPVVTRLAPLGGTINSTKLVFDSVDGGRTLSEVWLPSFDGFLVHATEGEHKHEVLAEGKAN